MEEKLNISSILKDKPKNTKLYSPIFGECFLDHITKSNEEIWVKYKNSLHVFDKYGRACSNGECMLFPSKDMRDWEKFSWRKGSVVVNGCGYTLLFDKWSNDIYTEFDAKYSNSREGYLEDKNLKTNNFTEVDCYTAYAYITEIERKLKGNLNLKTLEIEHPKPEFKDGDIVYSKDYISGYIYIYKEPQSNIDICYCYKLTGGYLHICDTGNIYDCTLPSNTILEDKTRLSTDSEKQQLFEALDKEGKAWDAEKKMLVDLPKKCEFKPMDYILIKNSYGMWFLHQFAFYNRGEIVTIGGCTYSHKLQILPYNEQTAHLLGTTDEWKGGEG